MTTNSTMLVGNARSSKGVPVRLLDDPPTIPALEGPLAKLGALMLILRARLRLH